MAHATRGCAGSSMKLGYLISQYPALSHTFVLREVLSLRGQGVDVCVVSVRRCDRPPGDLSADEAREARRTFSVMGAGYLHALSANVRVLLRHPLGYLRGLVYAWSLTRGTPRLVAMYTFYFLEGSVSSMTRSCVSPFAAPIRLAGMPARPSPTSNATPASAQGRHARCRHHLGKCAQAPVSAHRFGAKRLADHEPHVSCLSRGWNMQPAEEPRSVAGKIQRLAGAGGGQRIGGYVEHRLAARYVRSVSKARCPPTRTRRGGETVPPAAARRVAARAAAAAAPRRTYHPCQNLPPA